ncbi:alpha/beta hydrolase [Aquibacillus sediminis]|uniref:alpha/beta hydrolase n=1 Tax=Aquibacillus sediminis TaxID=2574734 RepID=UPI001109B4E2|nr:alpha/beta hydrolase [Aquibacillus sediminis]
MNQEETKVQQTEIEVGNHIKIRGSMAIPKIIEGKMPAVIIIAGSGSVDRDGNVTKPEMELNLYKDLAMFITGDLGFITVRYDKRGVGKSDGDHIATGFHDLVEDAGLIYDYLKNHANVDKDRIIVAGHSEGTIIGTALTETRPVAGLLLLSGGISNLEEALYGQRQLAYQELMNKPGLAGWLNRLLKIDKKNEKKVQKMNQRIMKTNKDVLSVMGIKQPAKWMREHFNYHPRESLKKVACPVLVIRGDKDNLVDNSEFKELNELMGENADYYVINNMEHGLREQTEEKSILNAKKLMQQSIGKPLHPEAKERIANWLVKYFTS